MPKTTLPAVEKFCCGTGLFLWLGGSMMIWEIHGNHWTPSFFPCFFNIGFQYPMVSVSTSITHLTVSFRFSLGRKIIAQRGHQRKRATRTIHSTRRDMKKCAVRILLRPYNKYIYSMIIISHTYIYIFIFIYSFYYVLLFLLLLLHYYRYYHCYHS